MNRNYQLGLLHFVYVLINSDEAIDDREMETVRAIQHEEKIEDSVFQEFSRSIATIKRRDIYNRGIELLNTCNEDEKLTAFAHLFRLAESDSSICLNEVKHLLYAIKATKIEFEDVAMIARMSSQKNQQHRTSQLVFFRFRLIENKATSRVAFFIDKIRFLFYHQYGKKENLFEFTIF